MLSFWNYKFFFYLTTIKTIELICWFSEVSQFKNYKLKKVRDIALATIIY